MANRFYPRHGFVETHGGGVRHPLSARASPLVQSAIFGAGQVQHRTLEDFAGLDVSVEETHVCVVDRDCVVGGRSKSRTRSASNASAGQLFKPMSECEAAKTHLGTFTPAPAPAAAPRGEALRGAGIG